MRAQEFVPEAVNQAIMRTDWEQLKHQNGYDLIAQGHNSGISVYAFDANDREIGWAHFEVKGDHLESVDSYVSPELRRQGIATLMYNYAQELGNDIRASTHQTRAGKRFWRDRLKKPPVPHWQDMDENFADGKVNEVIKMPPVNMVFSDENLIDWAYNDAQKNQAQQLAALKTDVPTKVYDMGDHLRVFVVDDQGPVLYLALEKFLDGFKTNAVQIYPRGQGKNLAFKIYQAVSDTFQRPLYSDYTHTDASRLGIWKKLIDQFPDRMVGYDQRTKEDLPLSTTPQGPAVRGNQPVYAQRGTKDQSKPVTGDTRSRTRLLKFLPAVNENFADGRGPGRPGDSVRHGIPKHATMAELEKASHASGRKGQLARWQLNMRRGKKRKHKA